MTVTPASSISTIRPEIVRLGEVPSTQAIAFELAAQGAPDRTVVLADHQTAGRGRLGRRWEDEPGASLLASILLRPRLEPHRLSLLSYVAAIAVAEALAGVASLAPRLKWPNDVLVDGLKIAGILLESRMSGSTGRVGAPRSSSRPPTPQAGLAAPATTVGGADAQAGHAAPATTISVIALGIGINLTQRQFEAALAARATSVALASGRTIDRETMLAAILERLDVWRARLEDEGFEPVRARWLALSDTIGRQISIEGQTGLARDLDDDGALILETSDGPRRVVAGEVREP
ncbi:MAG TPA: biotin--[acetyl-CoA-carboxylase] ligase [Methylomirabilota bacterium]